MTIHPNNNPLVRISITNTRTYRCERAYYFNVFSNGFVYLKAIGAILTKIK